MWNFQKLNFLVTRFMKEMSYVFLFTFFFHLLVAASISHFLTTATNFSCCPSKKECLLWFLSLALALCRSFSRWAFSFSLSFSFSIFQICERDNYSKLNTLENTDTETIFAFRFCVYWHFSCLRFKRRGWLCDFPPFGLPYLLIALFHIGMPVVQTSAAILNQ